MIDIIIIIDIIVTGWATGSLRKGFVGFGILSNSVEDNDCNVLCRKRHKRTKGTLWPANVIITYHYDCYHYH